MIKTLKNIRIEENFLNLVNITYKNLTDDVKLSGDRLNTFFLRSGTKQGYSLSPLTLIQHSII